MRLAKCFAFSALLAGIGLVPSFARGQAGGQFSDLTTELLSDGNGNKVPFTPGIYKGGVLDNGVLNEDPNGAVETAAYTIAPANFGMFENPTSSTLSDLLSINSYNVNVVSDGDSSTGQSIPLPRRTNAILIPAAAGEVFLPLSIFVTSDGDQSGTSQVSDTITITAGFVNAANPGTVVFSQTLPEPTDPNAAEGTAFTIPALQFDLAEANPTGGSVISDYFDIPASITGTFISSDNPQSYPTLPNGVDGAVVEDPVNGAQLHYVLGFASDSVPEPASFSLLGLGALGLMARRNRKATAAKAD